MPIWKKCNIQADDSCERQYDMELRKEAIKYEVFGNEPPYYDRCDSPNCQSWGIIKNQTKSKRKKK